MATPQYENTKDFASPLAKITKRVEQTKAKLTTSEERQTSLAKEETLARAKLRTCEEKRNEAKNGLDEKEVGERWKVWGFEVVYPSLFW